MRTNDDIAPLEPDDGTHKPNPLTTEEENKEPQSIKELQQRQALVKLCKENNITPETKCEICGDTAEEIMKQYDGRDEITDGTFSDKLGGWVCFPCRESSDDSPQGTVIIYSPKTSTVTKYVVKETEDVVGEKTVEDGDLENLDDLELCDYDHSPIQFEWIRTDAWRGYYEPVGKAWKVLHSDCILSGSDDEHELKNFDTDMKHILWKLGREFAVVFSRTSNLFSSGYDILVKAKEETDILREAELYSQLVALNLKYRDPERFRITALTGKSSGFNENDKILAEASKRFEAGESFEKVSQDILSKLEETNKND